MNGAAGSAQEVIAKARAGNLPAAIMTGEDVLAIHPEDAALRLFVGVLCCRNGELDRGITHLRQAVEQQPDNPVARIEFARALLGIGDSEAALEVTASAELATPQGRELMRVRGHALQKAQRISEARATFSALASAGPGDFESHNGLGLALFTLGDSRGAFAAFREAVRLQPSGVTFLVNMSRAAASLSEWNEARHAAELALARAPRDVPSLLVAARARAGLDDRAGALAALEAVRALGEPMPEAWAEIAEICAQMRNFEDAERAFRRAIESDETLVRAWVGLGNVLERLNRQAHLTAHLEAAAVAGIPEGPLALLHARAARQAGNHDEALAIARAAPTGGDPATRAQLIGTLADRLGDYRSAFAAFTEANAAIAASSEGMTAAAESNLGNYAAMRALMTPAWLSGWPSLGTPPSNKRRDPLFIFGFPRSGTTLIDTMLSGHPDCVVLEEESIIQRIASTVGQVERVPLLWSSEVRGLRDRYFEEVDARVAGAETKLAVDKEPLGLSSTLLLHRLFPDARFVFAERHPCDVVLSCWMTSLRFNHRVGTFHDLVAIARFYDAVLGFWTQCVDQLPIATTTVRYERLITAPETELRKLAEFAGLEWRHSLLANEENAARRSYIGSPSYAQVGEPLYSRAAGRWVHYRPWIDPILPILRPWIDQLGYREN